MGRSDCFVGDDVDSASWQLRRLEDDWWHWRILCWVRDSLLFTWLAGAVLMLVDEGEGKTFGFWLLWVGLAGWPIIMVLGHRLQEKAKDVERQYRPYIRGWLSWQALGWMVLGPVFVTGMLLPHLPWTAFLRDFGVVTYAGVIVWTTALVVLTWRRRETPAPQVQAPAPLSEERQPLAA